MKSVERPVPLEYAYSEIPLAQTLEKLVAEGKAPGLRRPLHAEGRRRQRAGLHEPQPLHARGEERGRRRDRGLPLHEPLRPLDAEVAEAGHRPPPRGPPAEVPRPRRAARPEGPAEGHLRHRHARGRHQRADPDRALLAPVQVRRAEDGRPLRARLPPDLRPRRPQGLRRPRLRGRAGARARDREPAPRREGEGGEEGRQEKAARAQLRELGPRHVQAPDRRRARAAHVALRGLARDAPQRPLAPRRRLPRDAAARPRVARERPQQEGALRAGLAALPRARRPRDRRDRPRPGDGGEGARQRRAAGRLLDGPGALDVPPRDAAAPRPRVGDLRPRHADPRRVDPREPRARPAPPARQGEGPGGRRDEGRRASTTTRGWPSSRSSSTRSRCATSCT